MVYCTKCGELNEDGIEYCKKCGVSLAIRDRTRRVRSDRDMCFGVSLEGHIWTIFFGLMIILWGVSQIVNIDVNLFAIVAVVFGIYLVWNALKASNRI
jgi:uncharacterized membrane protein YvbJ